MKTKILPGLRFWNSLANCLSNTNKVSHQKHLQNLAIFIHREYSNVSSLPESTLSKKLLSWCPIYAKFVCSKHINNNFFPGRLEEKKKIFIKIMNGTLISSQKKWIHFASSFFQCMRIIPNHSSLWSRLALCYQRPVENEFSSKRVLDWHCNRQCFD